MFAALYIPDFPVEAVVRLEPGLRERAVAILDGAPPLLTVIAMNEKASQAGIELGMPRLQAAAYAVELRPRSPLQEAAAHAALLDCAQAFSPRVEDTAPDTVVLDLAGLERLFGPPARLARELARRASELGLGANVAVAGNPDAAIHATRELHPGKPTSGLPGTPRGKMRVTVIPPGKEAERLGGLPVDVLQLAPEMLETLERWGVRTLRALAALPEVAVTERLGQEGLRLQKLARGATSRPLVPADPPLHFAEALELEHPVALLEPLAFLLGRLLEQLCARLAARALATNELKLRLDLDTPAAEDHHAYERRLRLPVPMLDSRILLKLLQLELKAHPPGAPVVKVALTAEPVRPRRAQGGLFLPLAPEPARLELTLARLRGVTGGDRVGAPELLDTHRPGAFRMTGFAPGVSSIRQLDNPAIQPSVLALRVFRPPLRASVELRSGQPVRISAPGVRGEVTRLSGPWRTSGEWWGDSHWARDEWDIALGDGQGIVLYRMYCDLDSGEWFIEGSYD